jgi:hypothetical protein
MKRTPYPLALPDDLLREVRAAAAVTGLSLAADTRQSMKRGLPRLREQLAPPPTLRPASKAEAKHAPASHEVLLEEANGLAWPSLCC